MVSSRAAALLLAAFAATTASSTAFASPVTLAERQTTPAPRKTIHPGVNTNTAGSCTSNFIFKQGETLYIGQAAHCASTGSSTDTDGCSSGSLPEGTPVNITGATRPGKLAYSSWIRMAARGETDVNACAYNDFALVAIDPADYALVDPTVPQFGGPTGLATAAETSAQQPVFSYGNSILRQGITLLSPKYGVQVETQGEGWSHLVYTLTPGVPGDSGSGFYTSDGKAFGTLSTLALAPLPLSNGVGDLRKELDYARSEPDFANVELVTGGPFRVAFPPQLTEAPKLDLPL